MNDKTYDGPCKLCGYQENTPCIPAYLAPKTFLNERYIVGKLLSYNGEGAVYIGFDTAAGIKVTIKEFMPDTLCSRKKGEGEIVVSAGMMPLYKTYMSEFADLGKSLMKSRGMSHIQTVLDVFYENNTCYTVFEFINGISLKTYLANSAGEMSWEQVKELFPPILTTISLIHSAGIIHRGISPQTIFVTDKMELKLTGFSISAARTTNTEIACEVFAGYAAPEQYTNEINGTWTDVYGIAAVLYRVLTGANPQEAIARTGGSMLEPMMINRNVPANISKVIMNGMRLSTESRIRSITEFVDKLFAQPKYGSDGKPVSDRPLTKQQQKKLAKQKKERVKTLIVLGIAGAVLIAFAIVFAMTLGGAFAPQPDNSSSEPPDIATSESPGTNSGSVPADTSEQGSGEAPTAPETSDDTNSSNSAAGANISLPDFTNRSFENTVSRYEGTFTFIPDYEYSEEYSAGMMYDQSINAGTMVSEGIQIEVKVSKGRSLVPLPDYVGVTLPEYISKLNNLNIKYSVENKRTNDVDDGYVAECSKEIGDLVNVEEGETIIVYAARNFKESKPETSEQEQRDEPLTEDTSPLPGGRIPVN
ncbi:MAG: PASTA domain-containing protein [Oscillospiraceae bacterium]|nr:PASTA domain-containing protein [Oscillospiraceae bacterium]